MDALTNDPETLTLQTRNVVGGFMHSQSQSSRWPLTCHTQSQLAPSSLRLDIHLPQICVLSNEQGGRQRLFAREFVRGSDRLLMQVADSWRVVLQTRRTIVSTQLANCS